MAGPEALLHDLHVPGGLDGSRNPALLSRRQARILAGENFTCVGNETTQGICIKKSYVLMVLAANLTFFLGLLVHKD